MLVVTGHSHKNDGICVVVDTNDRAEALLATVEAWNKQFTDQMQLVIGDQGDYLLKAGLNVTETIAAMDDETPRREGFALYTNQIEIGKIAQNMPW